ncbi:hypothetical protein, partial [uncultured Ferrimonas sp.]|uniref:hypothetical protein n=1 Tax=uncultured Ferrimonas sp. TaxID=432640 RepID=UPI0026125F29
PEWPKGPDCKSDGTAFDGSNPSPSTIFYKKTPSIGWRFFMSAFPCAFTATSVSGTAIRMVAATAWLHCRSGFSHCG